MSKSALLPSFLLAPLSILSVQQQKILRIHGKYLNMQKYLSGKKLYLAFIEAKSQPNQTHYKLFLKQFQSHNYVNKMFHISSIKYYRDIKNLLIGEIPDAGIIQYPSLKYVDINEVIMALDAAAYIEDTVIEKRKSKLVKNSKNQKDQQQNTDQNQLLSKYPKRLERKFLSSSTLNEHEEERQKLKNQQLKNSNTIKNSKAILKSSKFLEEKSLFSHVRQVQSSSQPAHLEHELQFIKLVKIQDHSQTRAKVTRSEKKQRIGSKSLNKNQAVKYKDDSNAIYKISIKNPRITSNLQQNPLYYSRQQWKSQSSSIKMQYLKIPNKSTNKPMRKKGSSICDKILNCLRWIGFLKIQNKSTVTPQKAKDKQQMKNLLTSTKDTINNFSSKKTSTNSSFQSTKLHYK